jgi:UDPglucose--hexose-1-phosphate uridylyltransferase
VTTRHVEPASRVLGGAHRRHDPLSDEWVLVSSGRARRPWLGSRESEAGGPAPAFDPSCYLCPGNERAGGERNPEYRSTFVFTNDFAALDPTAARDRLEDGLLLAQGEPGTCRVVCFSPRHDLTLARLSGDEVRAVIDVWADQTRDLGERFAWVQVFENRGAAMGASNPHPHGQIWAGATPPNRARRETETQARHLAEHGASMLPEYAAQEVGDGSRTLVLDDEWLVVVPFWAAWPFETLLIPRRPATRVPDLDDAARTGLGAALARLLTGYDRLFDMPFPYSMGWHQAPFDGAEHPEWQLHGHVYPPLLRADVRKFMVGYELLAEPQRDLTPEDAAARLRSAMATPEAAS